MSYMELELNLRDRDSSSSSSANYTCALSQPIQNVKGIRLLRVVIPRSQYNISSALSNNKLDFIYNGTTYAITIPDAAYDEVSLTGKLASLMSTATSTTINASYGSATSIDSASYKGLCSLIPSSEALLTFKLLIFWKLPLHLL